MSKMDRISTLLDSVLDDATPPRGTSARNTLPHNILAQSILDRLIVMAMDRGLDWHEIVCAVDEAERRTGLRLHPVGGRADGT